MNRMSYPLSFKVKAVFSSVLLLSLHVVVGCGTTTPSALSGGSGFVPLTADHPLSSALSGSIFQGASGIEVDSLTGRFRVIFPDGSRDLSGLVEYVDGKAQVRQLGLTHAGQSLTILFNNSHQITTMVSSSGDVWHHLAESVNAARAAASDGNPYVAANADIIEAARQFDANGGSQGVTGGGDTSGGTGTSTTGPKLNTQLATVPFLFVFLFLPAAAVGTVIFILELAAVVTLLF